MDKLIHLILLSGLVSIQCNLNTVEDNLAFKGTAAQSSTYYNRLPERAIDGVSYGTNISTYCSVTTYESNPWWRLDLLDVYDVKTVVITARSDGYMFHTSGAEIRIGNSLENNGNNNPICAVISGRPVHSSIGNSCHGMVGHYVNVVMTGRTSYLSLSEVEVYGTGHRKKTFLRLKFSSSVDAAAESDKILHQLQSALASHISDFHLSWTQLPKIEEEEEQEEDGGSCVKHL